MFNKCVFSKEKDLVFRVAASKNDIKQLIALKNVVNINSVGIESQQTAAHRAAAGGHIEALQLLFNLGADFSLRDKEGKAPRDYAKTEETKKIFLLIDEGYAALKARESVFSKTDNECSNDEKTLHERHWTVINKKIHQESEYEAAIKKIYKEEAGKKNLTVEEKAQFSLFQQKFSSSMLLLHHLVTKKIIFDVTTETGQKICSCGEAAASSFAWLAYFKKVDFPVEELNVTCKHDIRIAHAVLILNRDQNTLITDFNGWKESLIIDPYFNRIFFFNFVSQYAQDTCIKMVDKFNLIAGSSNILPPFPTEISLPATMSLYNKCVVELRESIWSKVKNNFLPLIDNTETDSRVELFSINTF